MVSNLDPVFMIFALSSITTLLHQQNTYVTVQLIAIETMVVSTLRVPLGGALVTSAIPRETFYGAVSNYHIS